MFDVISARKACPLHKAPLRAANGAAWRETLKGKRIGTLYT
jgi:hypothetical protein